MTTATTSVRDGPKRHRRRFLAAFLGGAVLAAGIGSGLWLWRRVPVSHPPILNLTGAEPVVAEAIEAARTSVAANPRSASAWGRLGMVLHAHDYLAEAARCYAQAEKLDSHDPRWPY